MSAARKAAGNEALRGRKHTTEWRAAISAGLKGNPKLVGKKQSDETRAKRSASLRAFYAANRPPAVSDETRRKMAAAQHRYRARLRDDGAAIALTL